MSRFKRLLFATALATSAVALNLSSCVFMDSASLNADVISFQDTHPASSTNWNDTFTVPQFDPALGLLSEVKITLEGTAEGTASYESLDASPASITLDLTAEIQATPPGGGALDIQVNPLAQQVDSAGAFDGTIDFGGTSGNVFSGLTDTEMLMASSNSAALLALYTGTGDVDIPVSAVGQSTGSGAGNLVLSFQTEAATTLTVQYTFTATSADAVPEPASGCLAIFGSLLLFRRRRRFS